MNLYSIKIKSLKIYKPSFVAADDQTAIAGVCEAIKRGLIDGNVLEINDLSLFRMAAFDLKNGITSAKPKLVTELGGIPGIYDFLKEVSQNVQDNV